MTISKVGTMKMVKHPEIQGTIKEIQIVRRNTNWYIVITTDHERRLHSANLEEIGIDVGLKDFLTLSNGIKYSKTNTEIIKKLMTNSKKRLEKIQKLQKDL